MSDEKSLRDLSTLQVLQRIADTLNVPVQSFLEGTREESDPQSAERDMLAAFRALLGPSERQLCIWFTRQLAEHRDDKS